MNLNVKMNFRNLSCDIEKWIKPSRDLVQWQSLALEVFNVRVLMRHNYGLETNVRLPIGAGVFLFINQDHSQTRPFSCLKSTGFSLYGYKLVGA